MRDRRVAGGLKIVKSRSLLGLLSSWPGGRTRAAVRGMAPNAASIIRSDRLLRAKATVDENVLSRGERSARRT
jgi:hypothetical protein